MVVLLLFITSCTHPATPTERPPGTPSHSTSQAARPSSTPPPSPTPEIRAVLSQGSAAVFGAEAYDPADLAALYAATHGDEQALLAQVPPEQRSAFLLNYLSIPSFLSMLDEIPALVLNPDQCPSRGYLLVPTTIGQLSPVPYGRSEVVNWGPPEQVLGWPMIAILCGEPDEGLRQVVTLREETVPQLTAQEHVSETVLSWMVQEFLRAEIGDTLDLRVDIVPASATQLTTYNAATGDILASDYFPLAVEGDHWQSVHDRLHHDVYGPHPPYYFYLESVLGFSIGDDPAVPIVATLNGVFTLSAALKAAAHRLLVSPEAGLIADHDEATVIETFAIIAERELFRDFLTAYYPDLANGLLGRTLPFDHLGHHIELPELEEDPTSPRGVYGASELGHTIFNLRNCTVDSGMSFHEFLDLVRGVTAPQAVKTELEECEAALASMPPTPDTSLAELLMSHEEFTAWIDPDWAEGWGSVPADLDCLPRIEQETDCAATAFPYSRYGYSARLGLRVYLATFRDAAAAAQASSSLRDQYLQTSSPLDWPPDIPSYAPLGELRDSGAWIVRDSGNGLVVLGFSRAHILSVVVLRSGAWYWPADEPYVLGNLALAQYERLEDYGYVTAATPTPELGAASLLVSGQDLPHPDCAQASASPPTQALTLAALDASPEVAAEGFTYCSGKALRIYLALFPDEPAAAEASSAIRRAYAAATPIPVPAEYPWLLAGAPWIVYDAATHFYVLGLTSSEATAVVMLERGIFCAEDECEEMEQWELAEIGLAQLQQLDANGY